MALWAFTLSAIIGALKIAKNSLRLTSSLLTYCCATKQNLLSKYGTRGKTYALVTGGTEGIGLELCRNLAAQGFNICIVSRNREKIERRVNELSKEYP